MKDQQILVDFGESESPYNLSFSPPIFQSSNFKFPNLKAMSQALQQEKAHSVYSRGKNPTVRLFECKMAALEQTEEALAFSSGIAAITNTILSLVQSGDHLVAIDQVYGWTRVFLEQYLPKFNIYTTFVSGNDLCEIQAACKQQTKIIYLESPSSWYFQIQDLQKIASWAKKQGIHTICDNSYATPIGQKPANFGIDLIVHSASKYLGGHSDLVGGIVCGPESIIEDLFNKEYMNLGGIMSPQTAWLLIRGLRTLDIRLNQIEKNRIAVENYLDSHPKVQEIIHPFHHKHPQKQLAQKQMSRGNGLFSVILKNTEIAQLEQFCNQLNFFKLAVSWGGHESLIFPALAIQAKQEQLATPVNMMRMYTGLDDAEVLIKDLAQALELL